ncbi:FHA domain-containing protein [Derxia gummosa]|uniref:FHA domain-containing protein n=1 Tax=Derxia gummosa DSM 723 TaxID=1121388 RepID=A0A8B6X957_9BURK|nr:FHA domain-containing protein [Derxia gummosa]
MLLNAVTGECVVLRSNHVFGRDAMRSDTHIPDPEVSMMHAVARWRDGGWAVADHSRNGTIVDGRFLSKGQWVPLRIDQQLRFGSSPASQFRVADLAPPGSLLVCDAPGVKPIPLQRNNLLPSAEEPELSIYQSDTGHWMLEREGEAQVLGSGATLDLAGQRYRLLLSDEVDETRAELVGSQLGAPRLCFRLSLDEEHTQLRVTHGAHEADLGERMHHYCLVTLARRRLADAHAGIGPADQGWLAGSDLARMLGMDIQHVNVQIFRARNQLMAALPSAVQLANIVERRRGSLRLGGFGFGIFRGDALEGEFMPEAMVGEDV